jgi:hypothetical protein
MATWPDLTEYHEALQFPQRSLSDPELQKAQIEKDRFGMPKPATGGNAVVYKATEGQNVWAVRCFLRPISDHAERYAAISKHLSKNRSAHSTRFVYLADGLRIKGGTFPIVKMEWVQGRHLDRCVEGLLDKPRELAALRERFRTLVKDIEKAKFAHGDLQHGNILVAGKDLLLIDYDGMWVPALIGRQATEIGHRAYQHPKRSVSDYGPWLDRFSALVIYLSLLALEIDRKLWEQYYTGDNLIFVREDFNEPGRSPVWGDLAALKHPEVASLAGILTAMVGRPLKDLPRLEAVLSDSAGLKPVELKASGARAPEKPRWTAKPSKSGTAADLAAQWKVVWSRPGEKIETRWKKEIRDGPVEVESEVEVLAPSPFGIFTIALAALGAGAFVGASFSPEMGMVAAGCGFVVSRGASRLRKKTVKHVAMKPTEQQVVEQVKVAVPGHKSAVTSLQCSADGRRLSAVTRLGECATWEVDTDGYKVSTVRMPPFEQSAFAANNPRAAVVTDKAILVADLVSGLKIELPVEASNRASAVALTGDAARVAIGQNQGQVHVAEAMTKKILVQIVGMSSRVTALAFSEDAAFLVIGWTNGVVQVHRLTPKPEKVGEGSQHKSAVTALAAAPKGQAFASGDDSGQIVLWTKSGQKQATASVGRAVKTLLFLGEHAVAAGCGDGSVKIVHPSTGAVIASHGIGTAAITALAFAKEKLALAAGTQSGQVTILALEA